MRFTVVDEKEIEMKCKSKRLKYVFMEFINMQVKAAKVDFTKYDYKDVDSAYNNLHKGAKRQCVPIRVIKRRDLIYFVRTDF